MFLRRPGASGSWSSRPPRHERIWHHLGPPCSRYDVKGVSWKVEGGKRAHVWGTSRKVERSRTWGQRKGLTFGTCLHTDWSRHTYRLPLLLCTLPCRFVLSPTVFLLSRLVEIQIPGSGILLVFQIPGIALCLCSLLPYCQGAKCDWNA
jgi:hypothetical protein